MSDEYPDRWMRNQVIRLAINIESTRHLWPPSKSKHIATTIPWIQFSEQSTLGTTPSGSGHRGSTMHNAAVAADDDADEDAVLSILNELTKKARDRDKRYRPDSRQLGIFVKWCNKFTSKQARTAAVAFADLKYKVAKSASLADKFPEDAQRIRLLSGISANDPSPFPVITRPELMEALENVYVHLLTPCCIETEISKISSSPGLATPEAEVNRGHCSRNEGHFETCSSCEAGGEYFVGALTDDSAGSFSIKRSYADVAKTVPPPRSLIRSTLVARKSSAAEPDKAQAHGNFIKKRSLKHRTSLAVRRRQVARKPQRPRRRQSPALKTDTRSRSFDASPPLVVKLAQKRQHRLVYTREELLRLRFQPRRLSSGKSIPTNPAQIRPEYLQSNKDSVDTEMMTQSKTIVGHLSQSQFRKPDQLRS